MDNEAELLRHHRPAAIPLAVATRDVRPLRRAERFLLAAFRKWRFDWECWEDGEPNGGMSDVETSNLEVHFDAAGLSAALPDFSEAMEALLFYSRRGLAIRPPSASPLSRDEERLLTLCTLSQAGSDGLVMASLAVIMHPCHRPVTSRRLSMATTSLRAGGLLLPPPAMRLKPRLH